MRVFRSFLKWTGSLILILFAGPSCTKPAENPTLAERLKTIGFSSASLAPFVLGDRQQLPPEGSETIYAEKQNDRIKIQVFNQKDQRAAQAVAKQHQSAIEGTYQRIFSPYRAAISNMVNCDEKLRPVRIQQGAVTFWAAFTNSRLAYGSCFETEAAYLTGWSFFYNEKDKRVIKIEVFVPKGDQARANLGAYFSEWPPSGWQNITPE